MTPKNPMATTRRRRRLLAVPAALVLALSAAACGDDATGDADRDVSLRMTVWTADETQLGLFDTIAQSYLKDHPEVSDITFDPIPFEGYTTAVTTQIAGSNPPDLAWVLERDALDFVSSGALADLRPTLQDTAGYELDDLAPSATALWTKGDALYAYPFSSSPMAVFYNADLLAKAGVDKTPEDLVADSSWTWDSARDMAAQVAARTPAQGLVVRDWDYKNWIVLASVWRGFGADAWSEDGTECGFDDPEMTQAMTFLHDAIFDDKALPAPGTTADFFAGESGLTITQISRASLLAEDPFDWGIVPLPSGPAGAAQVIGQAGIGVIGKSQDARAAADFLAYFTNPENSQKLATYFPPPRESQLNAESLAKASPLFTPEQLDSVVVDGIKQGEVLPSHTDSNEIGNSVQAALDPLWEPDADVASVLSGVCEAIEPDLS
jgi:multiple sugar transport system substrate-binding protein